MGRFYVPINNVFNGPWLVSQKNLEDLDDVIDKIDLKLKKALTNTIERTLKQQSEEEGLIDDNNKRTNKLKRKYHQISKKSEMVFTDGTRYEADNLKGIINFVNSRNHLKSDELYVKVLNGSNENEFRFFLNANEEGEYQLEYQIKCLDEEIQDEIKRLIDDWRKKVQASTFIAIWPVLRILVAVTSAIMILIGLANSEETISKIGDYKIALKKEIQKVIEKGISQENINEAVTLLIKFQTDYVPENIKKETITVINPFYRKMWIVALLIFILCLPPIKTTIGIGQNYTRLSFYKFWSKSLMYTIPTAIIWPWVYDIIRQICNSYSGA